MNDEPDRFDYILLTAKSARALAPYQSRKDVSAAIDKALTYLSEQQLPSGGFVKYGDEDVEEDAAGLEMLAALGISLTDERFTKDGHTVLDGMMGWYQDFYFEEAPKPGQGSIGKKRIGAIQMVHTHLSDGDIFMDYHERPGCAR